MAKYYCEICNKNVEVPNLSKLNCNECGFSLVEGKLTTEDIAKRNGERTAYCHKCSRQTFSVPIQFFINEYLKDILLFKEKDFTRSFALLNTRTF